MDCSKSVYESRKWLYARVLRISILLLWLISVCSMCFAGENVEVSSISGVSINADGEVFNANNNIYYFEVEPGYTYTFFNRVTGRYIGFSNNIVGVGDVLNDVSYVDINSSISFTYSDYGYVYFNVSYADVSYVDITREPLLGQKGAVDKIIYYVLNDLWPTFGQLATVISFTVVFALCYYLLKYYLQRISKGKE